MKWHWDMFVTGLAIGFVLAAMFIALPASGDVIVSFDRVLLSSIDYRVPIAFCCCFLALVFGEIVAVLTSAKEERLGAMTGVVPGSLLGTFCFGLFL